jgi:hypothetical protein
MARKTSKRAVQMALGRYLDAAVIFRKVKEGEMEMKEGATRVNYLGAQRYFEALFLKKVADYIGYPEEPPEEGE